MWKYVPIYREKNRSFILSLFLSKQIVRSKKKKKNRNNLELTRIFTLPRAMQSRLLHSSRTGGNSIPQ